MSRLLRDLYFGARRTIPEPTPVVEPEPVIEVVEEEAPVPVMEEPEPEPVIEEPEPEPTWWQLWSTSREQAQSLVLSAQAQAQDVRRRAHSEGAAEGYAAGYQEGLARGHEQGFASGHAEGYESGHALAIT